VVSFSPTVAHQTRKNGLQAVRTIPVQRGLAV
jgi:hypothetical protein